MKYLVTRTDDEGNLISMSFEFQDSGLKFLKSWTVEGEWPTFFWRHIFSNPPLTPQMFERWEYPGTTITEVLQDVSFDAFWTAYSYKVGDKKKAEKLWNGLPDVDRLAALKAIPRYLHFLLCSPGLPQAHATTFLGQRRFENEFNVKK